MLSTAERQRASRQNIAFYSTSCVFKDWELESLLVPDPVLGTENNAVNRNNLLSQNTVVGGNLTLFKETHC